MKKRLLLLIAPVIALILECLPYGVILKFADAPDSTFTVTYSYFSLTPFGWANLGPLPAAALTCVVILLTLIYVFAPKQGLAAAAAGLSIFAGLLSVLAAIMFGLEYLTVINVAVTLLLFTEAVMVFVNTAKGT